MDNIIPTPPPLVPATRRQQQGKPEGADAVLAFLSNGPSDKPHCFPPFKVLRGFLFLAVPFIYPVPLLEYSWWWRTAYYLRLFLRLKH
jgi:hypothetical protein